MEFPMKRVATIGECMIELRHTDSQTLKAGFGGDTLNTAVYLARAGRDADVRVDYISALGDDAYSQGMVDAWREEGIGVDLVVRLPGRLPGLYIIRTDERGERSFTYFRSAAAARDMLRDGRDARLTERLAGYACLYLSGITLSILDDGQRHALMTILDRLRAGGTQVAFDSNYRPAGWPRIEEARRWMNEAIGRCDIALPTLDDEQRLFGDADADTCLARLRETGVREIVLKLGAEGSMIWSAGASTASRIAPMRVAKIVDTTAAGDSFNAGYLYGRLMGQDPVAAATIGSRLAAVKVQHPGAIIPRGAMPDLDATRSPSTRGK
jgi:2-dehydro-3-deoxygluconokinase